MNLLENETIEINEIIWLYDGCRRKLYKNSFNSIIATITATTAIATATATSTATTTIPIIKQQIINKINFMRLKEQATNYLPIILPYTNVSLIKILAMELKRRMNFLEFYKLSITCHLIINILLLITTITTLVIKLLNFTKFHINFMYKHLKKTKLNVLLYLCWCAIIFQRRTEAFPITLLPIPAATIPIIQFHITNTGHNLILPKSKNNNYQYHHQNQNQNQNQNRSLNYFLKDPALTNFNVSVLRLKRPTTINRRESLKIRQQKQQQEKQVHQHYFHHLHQRAVNNPFEMAQCKPSYAEATHVTKQMNTSLLKMRNLFQKFLQVRNKSNQEKMWETWQKHNLAVQYPNRKPSTLSNEIFILIETFYLNLNGYQVMCQDVIEDTEMNRNEIEHGEDYKAQIIIDFFNQIKIELRRIMLETEKCLRALSIPKPDLTNNYIVYDRDMQRKPREFLIVHSLLKEIDTIYKALCK